MYEKFISSPLECMASMEEALTHYAAEKDNLLPVDGQPMP
jgi:hypothetical protein